MAVIDSNQKKINFKIVYVGPDQSGKTTSLEQLQSSLRARKKTKIRKKSGPEKTLFFDFLPLASGKIGGFETQFQIYTVPGQKLYEENRRVLLKGVDGVIFVADSQLEKVKDSLDSLHEFEKLLSEMDYNLKEIPLVLQYNKRDLPNAASIDEVRRVLNINHVPDFETVATTGEGVLDAFNECLRQVVKTLEEMKKF